MYEGGVTCDQLRAKLETEGGGCLEGIIYAGSDNPGDFPITALTAEGQHLAVCGVCQDWWKQRQQVS